MTTDANRRTYLDEIQVAFEAGFNKSFDLHHSALQTKPGKAMRRVSFEIAWRRQELLGHVLLFGLRRHGCRAFSIVRVNFVGQSHQLPAKRIGSLWFSWVLNANLTP